MNWSEYEKYRPIIIAYLMRFAFLDEASATGVSNDLFSILNGDDMGFRR